MLSELYDPILIDLLLSLTKSTYPKVMPEMLREIIRTMTFYFLPEVAKSLHQLNTMAK
jgi:hypothetical protein